MRLFWINDPVYYSQYATIKECPYQSEKEVMRLLRAIKQRFKHNDFRSAKLYFDPTPWIQADDVDLETIKLPEAMLHAISSA